MFNSYDFEEQSEWVKQDCTCDKCKKELEELTERCLLAEGEIVSVEDFTKTVKNIKDNAILTLAEDLTIDSVDKLEIPVDTTVVLDLNGKTLNYTADDILFRVNGDLTIKNGTFKGVGYVASANKGAKVTVVDGDYQNDVTCFQANGGTILIEGGHYSATSEKYGTKYLLNHIDKLKNEGLIKVTGGTFVNYNPAASESEDPVMNFVAEGYTVEVEKSGEDTLYKVVKK